MLTTADLTCARGDRLLFSGLEFTLSPGDVLTVLGENGSGKSSLLRILCGLLPPDRGAVLWEGTQIRLIREAYAGQLIYVGHLNGLKDDLTPREHLRLSAELSGEPCHEETIGESLAAVGLDRATQNLPARTLSQGQKRRATLSRLWCSTRRLWVLDEPFAALDETGISLLTTRLCRHGAQGGIVVMATHQEMGPDAGPVRRLRLGA